MPTHKFQESTVAIIKAVAGTQVEAFFQQLGEVQKERDTVPAKLLDDSTKAALTEHVTASFISGVMDNKSSEESVEHLATTLAAKSTPPLSNEEAVAVADALLRPTINGVLQVVTNPEDTSLGDDKVIIRDAVMGWGRSVKVHSDATGGKRVYYTFPLRLKVK